MSAHGPRPARGGAHQFVCAACGKIRYSDEPRQQYCDYHCKRAAQNRRYYQQHRRSVIQSVIERRKAKG